MKRSRSKLSLVVVAAAFFATATAGAVEVSIIGATSATITEGGAFTIDLGIDNASLDSTAGFDGTISGLAAAGIDVTGGRSAPTYLSELCFPEFGCFNGLDTHYIFFNPNDHSDNYHPGDDQLMAMAASVGHPPPFPANDGSIDLGVANDLVNLTPSAIDSTTQMIATVVGVHEFTVGGFWSDGVNWLPLAPSTFTLTVLPIPEPGTALLLGLGLTGLATSGRRKNEGQ